jgi:hypothetical protein
MILSSEYLTLNNTKTKYIMLHQFVQELPPLILNEILATIRLQVPSMERISINCPYFSFDFSHLILIYRWYPLDWNKLYLVVSPLTNNPGHWGSNYHNLSIHGWPAVLSLLHMDAVYDKSWAWVVHLKGFQ